MKKLDFLLLDANVVIELFRLGLWEKITDICDIHLAETVIDESEYYIDEHNEKAPISRNEIEAHGKVTIYGLESSSLGSFRSMFDITVLEDVDPGEAESLAILWDAEEEFLICSADAIVFRILGLAGKGHQGISLEEILQQTGFRKRLEYQFIKAFRDKWTQKGFEEKMMGYGPDEV